MTWNYRVIRHPDEKYSTEDLYFFAIHSVHYTDDIPDSWSLESYAACGETVEILSKDLNMMIAALAKPVLEVYIYDGVEKLREVKNE